jgi:hypothetical protein
MRFLRRIAYSTFFLCFLWCLCGNKRKLLRWFYLLFVIILIFYIFAKPIFSFANQTNLAFFQLKPINCWSTYLVVFEIYVKYLVFSDYLTTDIIEIFMICLWRYFDPNVIINEFKILNFSILYRNFKKLTNACFLISEVDLLILGPYLKVKGSS